MQSGQRVVVLVRHGETQWTRSAQHAGRADIPLSAQGRAEAERLRDRLAALDFARVFVSPLSRARQTCALAGYGQRAEERAELLEWDYGAYQGLTAQQVLATRPDWALWQDGCPGGETAVAVGARVDRLLEEVARVEGNVLLFAHGHLLRVVAARWMGLPPEAGARLALFPASVSVLGLEHGARVVWTWNDVCHLQR